MVDLTETIKWINTFQSTIDDMCSIDHNRQLMAELNQLRIRIKKLDGLLTDYVAGTLQFEPRAPYETLYAQLQIMRAYEAILIMRVENEVKNDN